MNKTPPPQTFSPSRGDQHNQGASQRQYHNSFSEQVVSPWRQGRCLDDHSDENAGFLSGFLLTQNTPPDNGSSSGSFGWTSPYSTADSYGSSNTSCSQDLGSIDPSLRDSYQIPLTGMPLVASPDGLVPTAFSPTLLHYPSGSAAQAAVQTTHLSDDYFAYNPNYSKYPVGREHQPANGPQDQESYPNLNTSNLVPALPPPAPPYQPTHHGEEGGTIADHPNPSPHKCHCGAAFGRQTDLERHQRTTRKHNGDQGGLPCPVKGCIFTTKFTRDQNFRTHCRRQHGMSVDEVNTYIREWKDRRPT
ncbi:hypothetical protein B9Z19DRAFT_1061554 [Tuber borchii]|uniref:C2H2-type domain-containing protein n=1 Tax=Tuber borchii TaxID=42251 RepID=A0A2T7A4X4_TUBBO|nr:hypothetical protein B9Z19DRAFT_1061554 [Tuber borchii]